MDIPTNKSIFLKGCVDLYHIPVISKYNSSLNGKPCIILSIIGFYMTWLDIKVTSYAIESLRQKSIYMHL